MSQLSKNDFLNETGLKIIPFDSRCLKGASYDVSPSIIAMSTKLGMLETVYRDKNYPYKLYIYVKAKDTVLVVTKEYISVPSNIAGYVVSRVSKVSEGFGHVSTSIDPNWKGALLIALSNPSNKPIKVFVGNNIGLKSNSLATVSFHYLNTALSDISPVYDGMRLQLLRELCFSQRKGVKAWFRNLIHPYRKKFTNFFFDFCDISELNEKNWPSIMSDIQGDLPKSECTYCKNFIDAKKKKHKQHLGDFIITESLPLRFIHYFKKYWPVFCKTIAIIVFSLAFFDILPSEAKEKIEEILEFLASILNLK